MSIGTIIKRLLSGTSGRDLPIQQYPGVRVQEAIEGFGAGAPSGAAGEYKPLGKRILLSPEILKGSQLIQDWTLAHEGTHAEQYAREPFKSFFKNVAGVFKTHDDRPLEIQANEAADEFLKVLRSRKARGQGSIPAWQFLQYYFGKRK